MVMQRLRQAGSTSFGPTPDGPERDGLNARSFIDGERYKLLDRRAQFYECKQHDHKMTAFDGGLIPGDGAIAVHQPFLNGQSGYVPLRNRRPSSPYRLARVIVHAFTDMVFGENRFPKFKVEGDAKTQDFVEAIVKATRMPVRAIEARNRGGSTGASVLSWCFLEGKPRIRVHNPRDLFVHSWIDRETCIPEHVTEVYQYPKEEWDPVKKKYVKNMYWYRRDWTPDEDIVFRPILVEYQKDPDDYWEPDLKRSRGHDDGVIHVEWIQNLPSQDPDGEPDYEGLYDNFDTIDILASVISKGAVLNLDPTVVLKMDPDILSRNGVQKGSDNALTVGEDGDAKYMELAGSSIKAGVDLFNSKRKSILEVAQCVIPDPADIAAAGTSSVAQKMVYASMLARCDVLREQYAGGFERLLSNMVRVAQASKTRVYIKYHEDGTEERVKYEIDLPPKVTSEPVTDDEGVPTGEQSITMDPLDPGMGTDISSEWGPYFPPTPTDQQLTVSTLAQATGNQPFLSTQTATEIALAAFNRPAEEEHARIAKEQQVIQAKQAQMFADQMDQMGGGNGGNGSATATRDLPGGGKFKSTFGKKPNPFGGGGKMGKGKGNPPSNEEEA